LSRVDEPSHLSVRRQPRTGEGAGEAPAGRLPPAPLNQGLKYLV
jgi:hypothetical protein